MLHHLRFVFEPSAHHSPYSHSVYATQSFACIKERVPCWFAKAFWFCLLFSFSFTSLELYGFGVHSIDLVKPASEQFVLVCMCVSRQMREQWIMARYNDIDMLLLPSRRAHIQFITFKMHAVHFSLCQLIVCILSFCFMLFPLPPPFFLQCTHIYT